MNLVIEKESLLLRRLSTEMGDLGLQAVERKAVRAGESLDPGTFRCRSIFDMPARTGRGSCRPLPLAHTNDHRCKGLLP